MYTYIYIYIYIYMYINVPACPRAPLVAALASERRRPAYLGQADRSSINNTLDPMTHDNTTNTRLIVVVLLTLLVSTTT